MQVYPPDEDTFALEDAIVKDISNKRNNQDILSIRVIVEVGSGSGYISKVLREWYPLAYVISTDINPYSVLKTKDTCSQIDLPNGDAIRTSIINGIKDIIDLAIFNPPYIPSNPLEEYTEWIDKSWAGGKEGMEVINLFLEETKHINTRYLLLTQYNIHSESIKRLKLEYKVEQLIEKRVMSEIITVIKITKEKIQVIQQCNTENKSICKEYQR
ncbi:release factor glutamine methyltransferase [Nematocida sp. AWRm80]|nr:release factor glutamine methyltransferase [Nematocida sp. AWRm80]